MGKVFFNNGITVASWWSKLLDWLITALVNETDLQTDYAGYKEALMFHEQKALSLDETFSGIAWPLELDEISENWVKPEWTRTKLPNKWFEIIEYGEKLTTSYLMYQWIQTSRTIKWASSDIKKEWKKIASDAQFLIQWAMLRMSMQMTRVYTQWFGTPTASYWPGSPTPKWLPLFSIQHKSREWALTWRNMGTASNLNQPLTVANWVARLQDALDVLKTVVRLENWYKVAKPKGWEAYELLVSSELYPIAWEILNLKQKGNPSHYSGKGTNSEQTNIFNFDWNKVQLTELELLWDIDKVGNPIGTANMWFLRNPRYIRIAKAFKCIKLYDPVIKNYPTNDTDAQVIDIRVWYACDHYGAEAGVFGSKWDGDTAYNV